MMHPNRYSILRPVLLSGLFYAFLFSVSAQNTYSYRKTKDPLICASILTGGAIAYYKQQKIKGLDMDAVLELNRSEVYRPDRFACDLWNRDISRLSDGIAIGSALTYGSFLLNRKTRKYSPEIALIAFESAGLSLMASNLCKLSLRERPYMYNKQVDMNERMKSDGRFSFFSAHTAFVSSLSFSYAYSDQIYCGKGKRRKGIWIAAFTLPAVEGSLRVISGKHFPSDVITGYLFGFGSAWLTHRLHKKSDP